MSSVAAMRSRWSMPDVRGNRSRRCGIELKVGAPPPQVRSAQERAGDHCSMRSTGWGGEEGATEGVEMDVARRGEE